MMDIENLIKKFGDLVALDNLALHVNEGEVFGFLGPNGAEKTTTVRMFCRVAVPYREVSSITLSLGTTL